MLFTFSKKPKTQTIMRKSASFSQPYKNGRQYFFNRMFENIKGKSCRICG